MFIQSLIQAVAKEKFTFQIESNADDIIFTVMPSKSIPKCEGVIAQAHAVLAVPLRVIVKSDNGVDEAILAEIQGYIQQRKPLISNLDVLNKAVADATRAVKQESKDKASTDSVEQNNVTANKTDDKPPSTKSRSLEL